METSPRVWLFLAALCSLVLISMVTEGAIVKRVDTHAHVVPPFYFDTLMKSAPGLKFPKWNIEDHLAFMDSLDIELSVLSTPGARFPPYDLEEGRKLARQLNEYTHMLTVKYPGRFQFFATLTLPDLEGSLAEAKYAFDTLHAAGVILMTNAMGVYLGNKQFDPLMEMLNERKATVFVHPISFHDVARVTNDFQGEHTEIPDFMIDYLLDTTRAASNLVLNNVTIRYPDIKFLLAHSGGFVPFAGYRIAAVLSMLNHVSVPDALKELKRFYVDTALSSTPSALPSTLEFFPHDHITFGSDYPFAPAQGIKVITKQFDDHPLAHEQRHFMNLNCGTGLVEKSLSHWKTVWHSNSDKELL